MLQQGTSLGRSAIDLPSFFLPDSVKYTALKTQARLENKRVAAPDCDDTGLRRLARPRTSDIEGGGDGTIVRRKIWFDAKSKVSEWTGQCGKTLSKRLRIVDDAS